MKFNPTWSQVALLLGMLAAVVLTHAFAPPAVGVVTSIVSTVVGALFVDLRSRDEQKRASDAEKDNEAKGGDK